MPKIKEDPDLVWAAKFASTLAAECGLKPGNLWEPNICRQVLEEVQSGMSRRFVSLAWRQALGLLPAGRSAERLGRAGQ